MSMSAKQQWAFELVRQERQRQNDKWGYAFAPVQEYDAHGRLTVLTEEVGEIAHAILEKDKQNEVEEWVQVAAVAVAALEDLYFTVID